MVDINVSNVITIGLISIGTVIALKYGLGLVGINPSWL